MLEEISHVIPADIIKFMLIAVFALLIGLEQRRHYIKEQFETQFGTDRTFTLIGIFGFILYILNPSTLVPFLIGAGILGILLSIFYFQKIRLNNFFGITSIVTALITYCLAPLVYTQPAWLVLLIVVSVLVITELKEKLFEFSKKFDDDEFITLAKFLVLAGVILPLLPDSPVSENIPVSPYKFWLAIVAVSGISYFSYLLKKFVFPQSGIILTGILGGLYSSTATTIILSKKSRELAEVHKVTPAIFFATTMMYLRIFLLALFFNSDLALRLAPSFSILIILSALIGLYFLKFRNKPSREEVNVQTLVSRTNPLELKTSLIFSGLFIFFAWITGYVMRHYGTSGINILSFIVGVTDIDPFIINLFQNKWNIEASFVVTAVINASSSNNVLKMIYGSVLSHKMIRKDLIMGFSSLIIIALLLSFVFHF